MLGQRIYVKSLRLLQFLKRNFFKMAFTILLFCFGYWLVNDLFIEKSLLPDANRLIQKQSYKAALTRYNIALKYYQINHFTKNTKEKFFKISYKKSICLLNMRDSKRAFENILNTQKDIQWQYGFYSKENAYFIKNYLIDFFIQNGNINLAKTAFRNLVAIDKKIGYDYSELADVTRITGDIYFAQGKIELALTFYNNAYNIISKEKNPDLKILMTITNKICENELKLQMIENVIEIYKHSIKIVRESPQKQETILVNLLINLGNIYSKSDDTMQNALDCYNEAILISKKLSIATTPRQNLENYISSYKKIKVKNDYLKHVENVNAPVLNKI